VDIATPQGTWAIDTGFIVYNDRTYPRFMGLLNELGLSGQKTQMSFSVHNPQSGLEYNGHSLSSLFAQRRNLLKPAFWRLLTEIVRFNRLAKQALAGAFDPGATLQTFLERHRFSPFFARHYILPMGAAIWSSSLQEMRRFPLALFLRFFDNHGLLDIRQRPQWYVVPGGSREYVRALLARSGDRLRLRLNAPVQNVIRHQDGVTLQLASGSSTSIRRSSPATLPKRWPCWRTRPSPNAKYWGISAGSETRWSCTAIPAGCRCASAPGPAGTIA
jgi:predicted NAD/FAD-binding protein